jgi:hypothetical protein
MREFAFLRIREFALLHKTLEKALFYWGFGSVQGGLTTLRFIRITKHETKMLCF